MRLRIAEKPRLRVVRPCSPSRDREYAEVMLLTGVPDTRYPADGTDLDLGLVRVRTDAVELRRRHVAALAAGSHRRRLSSVEGDPI